MAYPHHMVGLPSSSSEAAIPNLSPWEPLGKRLGHSHGLVSRMGLGSNSVDRVVV